MTPRWFTGDLVVKNNTRHDVYNSRHGVVVGVRSANLSNINCETMTYPYVYYVFFDDGNMEGPLFQCELRDA